MRIVVFGATGNIGRRIVAEALARDHEVVGVVRDPAGVTPPDPRVRLVQGDATDAASVARVVRGMDQPDFPPAYMGEAREGADALDVWRREGTGLDWTFLSPAAEVGPGGRTGHYRTTDDTVIVDASGKSFITFEDYAVAVMDELEHPEHVGKRFGVAY